MKRIALALLTLFTAAVAFAQSDLKVLAVVKLNKNDSITVKQLKTRVESYEKQAGSKLSAADREKVLDAIIQEKLVLQAAQNSSVNIPDSRIDELFMQSISSQIGRVVTEAEFEKIIKEQTNMSLDEYMRRMSGMSVAEYKAYLKNQMIIQNYVVGQNEEALKSAAPTDEEIRAFYELNKTQYVWSDMFKMYLVMVPKGNDAEKARKLVNNLYSDFKNKKLTTNQMTVESRKEGSGYQSGEVLVNKTQQSAVQLGISYADLLSLFAKDKGFTSEIVERDTNFQFYTIIKKFDAKMLGLSDLVTPDTTTTVYDFIKEKLGQQKTMEFLTKAAGKMAKDLDTPGNVERKVTGAALQTLLSW